MIKAEDLKQGEVYYLETKYKWIVRFDNIVEDNIRGNSMLEPDKKFQRSYNNSYKIHNIIRLATPEEKHWLEVCERENTFVSKEESLKSFNKKDKFEVGKYYEIGNPKDKYLNIVKIKEVHSDNKITPCYRYNLKNTLGNEGGWSNSESIFDNISYSKELTLEEIQQYLPDNHPDKLKTKEYLEFKEYQCSPFPENKSTYFKVRVVKDIVRKDIDVAGSLPDLIPKGSVTWFIRSNNESWKMYIGRNAGTIHPENNRYNANIPTDYFEIIEEDVIIPTSKFNIGDLVSTNNKGYQYYAANTKESDVWSDVVKTNCPTHERKNDVSIKDKYYHILQSKWWYKTDKYGNNWISECGIDDKVNKPINNNVAELTSLPEKWCLKITKDNLDFCKSLKNNELGYNLDYKYTIDCYYSPIKTRSGFSGSINLEDRIEITFEQFKRWVLKEQSNNVVKNEKESLLEEAKRRYPEGAKFKCVNNNSRGESTIVNHSLFEYFKNYGIHQGNHWIVLYDKWAEIVKPFTPEHPEYYEYTGAEVKSKNFTVGKIYKIKNPSRLEKMGNFIDDTGNENGFGGTNYENFKPSTKEAFEIQEIRDSSSNLKVPGLREQIEPKYIIGIDPYDSLEPELLLTESKNDVLIDTSVKKIKPINIDLILESEVLLF